MRERFCISTLCKADASVSLHFWKPLSITVHCFFLHTLVSSLINCSKIIIIIKKTKTNKNQKTNQSSWNGLFTYKHEFWTTGHCKLIVDFFPPLYSTHLPPCPIHKYSYSAPEYHCKTGQASQRKLSEQTDMQLHNVNAQIEPLHIEFLN